MLAAMRRRPVSALLVIVALGLSTQLAAQEITALVDERALGSWQAVEREARDFEAENPGVKVRLIDGGGASGARDKVKFMLAGGMPLDLIRIDVTEFSAYLADGALRSIEALSAADPDFDAAESFGVLDGFRDPEGRLYGLVQTFTPYVMYANRSLLARAGIPWPKPDWTWDDLLEACRRATRDENGDGKTDVYGISLTQWLQAVLPWIWQNGGDIVDAKGERASIGEPAAVEAFGFLRRLLHEEKVASFDATFEDQLRRGLFQAGRTAFYGPVGYWEVYRFRDIADFEWDVLPLPRRRRAATSIAMQGYVIPRTSRRPDLAYRFMRRLAGPRLQSVYAEIGNGVPGLRAVAFSKSFLQPDRPPASASVFLDVLGDARIMGARANWRQIESLCQAELEGILLGGSADVDGLCRGMARKIDAYLERERRRAQKPRVPIGASVGAIGVPAVVLAIALALLLRPPRGVRSERYAAAAFLGPWYLGFVLFVLVPTLTSLFLVFSEWSPVRPPEDVGFVGAENLVRLLDDPAFAASFRATALYTALAVPIGIALGLGLAILVRRDTTLNQALRTVYYLPSIISPVVIAALWRSLLDADNGFINRALAVLGIAGPPWLRSTAWVVPAFVLMSLWSTGSTMLVFLTGLKRLDPRLEEAARLDGAGPWRRLRHVILPGLAPVLAFNVVVGVVSAFQIFAPAFVLTQGGPGDASRFLVLYVYETAFRFFEMGYGATVAWVIFVVLALATAALVGALRKRLPFAREVAA